MNFNKTYRKRQGLFDIEAIKSAAKGRAIEILEKVAGIDSALLDGKHHPCPRPQCGGTDRFRLIDANAGSVYCNQCFRDKSQGNWGDFISAVQWMNDCDFPTAIKFIGEYLGAPCGEFHRADISGIVNQTLGGVETSANPIRSIPATLSRTSAVSSNIASSPPSNKKPSPTSPTSASRAINPTPEKIFYYPNAKGKPAYRIVKYPTPPGEKKEFRQERFDNGRWVPGLGDDENGVKRSFIPYPYNFPRLMDDRTKIVFIVEGEKCANALQAILDAGDSSRQYVASTIAGGANQMKHWGAITQHADGSYLDGLAVVLLPDNDTPGHKGAIEAAGSILEAGYAESVSLVEFAITPHGEAAPDKYDIADWIGEHRADGKNTVEISTAFLEHVQTHQQIITPEYLAAMKQSLLSNASTDAPPAEEKMPLADKSSKNPRTKESDKQKLREVKLIPFSEVEDKPIDWLLKDMVTLGSITVFVGRPGVGKSFLTCWLASRIAFPTPRLFRGESVPQGCAVMVNAEDPENVIKQRLEKHGADTSRILLPKVYARDKTQSGEIVKNEIPLTLEMIGSFREMLEQTLDCRAIIIDPVSAFYGDIKENSNTDIRAVLAQLKSLAEEFNVAVILITHTNKGQSTDSSARTHGSRGLGAAARGVWFVVEDEAGTKTVCCDKNNLSENKDGFTYRIENSAVVIESETVMTTASAELAKESERLHPPAQRGRPQGSPKTTEATEMLLEILADGPKPVGKTSTPGTIRFEADQRGIGKNSIYAAKAELGIIHTKRDDQTYEWKLPDPELRGNLESCPD